MRRRLTALITVALVLLMAMPAASAATCGPLWGVARLHGHGDGTASGYAYVLYDGHGQTVGIESMIPGAGKTHQTWSFDEGDVEVVETVHGGNPLVGPFTSIRSTVQVQAPHSGNWTYNGAFNTGTLIATFIVRGYLCVT
ncbi:MAG: hypothetical protein WCE80_12680 [Acidimicrobiia bacterium]